MDSVLQAQFQRVETALVTLVDSIASYNPSPQAAVDLIAADDDLSRGLDQLVQHQDDCRRIQDMRSEAEALEAQLKSSVAALADLRRELFATPATTFPADSHPVPFDELLQYAKNIAKYTVPPTYRERIPELPSSDQSKEPEDAASSAVPSNGVGTPAQQAPQEPPQNAAGGEEKAITVEEAEWLKKLKASNMPWFPWPDDDKIRRGNLMQIQYLLDIGKDPTYEDLTKLAEDEKDRIAADAERQAAAHAQAEAQSQAQVQAEAEAVVAAQAAAADSQMPTMQNAPAPEPVKKPEKTFAGFEFAEASSDEDDDAEDKADGA